MPRFGREGPNFYQNKDGKIFRQSRNEKGQWSRIFIEEDALDRHSPEKYNRMLSEGPCEVIFRRVSSSAGGVRSMKCVKPSPMPKNAFDPRFPTLIAVVDLDTGQWRSFYYEQVLRIDRVLPKDLNYDQRKFALRITGQNYDKLFPGTEEPSLSTSDMEESFEFSEGGKYPAVLVNKQKQKEEQDATKQQQSLREILRKKEEQIELARQQRENLQATDNFNTSRRDGD